MKHEIFIIAVLHLTSVAKSLPQPRSVDSLKLQERLEPRDLTYDLSFGWFGTNENEGVLNPGIKIASQIHENSKTETVQSLLRALEEESKHADSEQQKKILSLIQDLNKILVETPKRYAKVLLNNVWHTIDMGVFGSTQRLRTKMTAEKFIDKLKKLILQILELFYQYFTQNGMGPGSTHVGQGQSDEIDPWEVSGESGSHSSGESSEGISDSESHGPTGGPGVEVESKESGTGSSTSGTDSEKSSDDDVRSGPGSGLGSGRGSGRGSGPGSAPGTNSPDNVASGESGSGSTENGYMPGEIAESTNEGSSTHGPSGVEAGSEGASSENPSSGELGGSGLSSGESSSSEEPPSVELGNGESTSDSSRRGSLGGSTTTPHSGMQSSGESVSENYDGNADVMKSSGNTNRPCPPQVKLTP